MSQRGEPALELPAQHRVLLRSTTRPHLQLHLQGPQLRLLRRAVLLLVGCCILAVDQLQLPLQALVLALQLLHPLQGRAELDPQLEVLIEKCVNVPPQLVFQVILNLLIVISSCWWWWLLLGRHHHLHGCGWTMVECIVLIWWRERATCSSVSSYDPGGSGSVKLNPPRCLLLMLTSFLSQHTIALDHAARRHSDVLAP